jgi:hypothetical protein
MSQEQKPTTSKKADSKHTIDSNEILSWRGGLLTVELKVNFSFGFMGKGKKEIMEIGTKRHKN